MTTSFFSLPSQKMVKKVLKMQNIEKFDLKRILTFYFLFKLVWQSEIQQKQAKLCQFPFFALFSPKMVKKVQKLRKIKVQNLKKNFFCPFWFILNHYQSVLFTFRADLIFKYPLSNKLLLCALLVNSQ